MVEIPAEKVIELLQGQVLPFPLVQVLSLYFFYLLRLLSKIVVIIWYTLCYITN